MFPSQEASSGADGQLASSSGLGDHSSLICMFISQGPISSLGKVGFPEEQGEIHSDVSMLKNPPVKLETQEM